MGCTPSIHVSDTGVIYCRDNHESPSTYSAANHQDAPGSPEQPKEGAGSSRQEPLAPQQLLGKGTSRLLPPQPTAEVRFGSMRLSRPPLKILLVFAKDDAQSEAFLSAADKLRYECTQVRSSECALESFQDKHQDVILIDCRHSKHFDGEALCRSIRNLKMSQLTVIVAVVKKSFAEREDAPILPLLNAGFDRCFVETGNASVCVNELLQLEQGEVQLRFKLEAASSLFTALDNCRDLVQITDSSHNIQYVNRSWEKLLGYSRDEVIGKNVQELHHMKTEGLDTVVQQLNKGKEWEGIFTCRRRPGDLLPLFCWIVPSFTTTSSSSSRGIANQFVYIKEPPPFVVEKSTLAEMGQNDLYPLPRGSLRSLRKPSYDIKSLSSDGSFSIIRRQSLAKIHSLTIEAPITKVINIISAAQENSPIYVAQALDKVLEILRTTELYSPQLFEGKGKSEDPMTTDLLGALLSQGPKPITTNRRSSNENAIKSHQPVARPSLPNINNAPIQIRQLLESEASWDFDIMQLEELTGKRTLVWLGMATMVRCGVPRVLGCDETTLQNWLTLIEANYHSSNTYHNSTHAADVMQATAYFLEKERLKQILDPLDEACCLIAAAVHDVDHPGKTSAFLVNSGNELAILYNDLSVLESHHSALSFKLTSSDERVNIFKGLDRETHKVVRQSIVDMVLATEMTKHFEHLSKFVNICTKTALREEDEGAGESTKDMVDVTLLATPENIVLVKRMLIKCADVSNPTRPLELCTEWAHRIAEEYCSQTDEEKTKGLPIVMPMFDKATYSIAKSQIGFVDYFISDMFDAWDVFADIPELLDHMKCNYQYWKELDLQKSEAK